MKLSKQQITALADSIHKDISSRISENNKQINSKNDKIITKLLSQAKYKELSKFATKFNRLGEVKNYVLEETNTKLTDKPISVNYNLKYDIQNEIILRTIECDNLKELIDSVTNKFIK